MTFIITLITLGFIVGLAYIVLTEYWAKPQLVKHDYFHRLWLWPVEQEARWEAEMQIASPYASPTLGIVAEDGYEVAQTPDPTPAEVRFCQTLLANIENVLAQSKGALAQGWREWFHEALPTQWQREFVLDGFSVPIGGDGKNHWSITFFCATAGHYFNVSVENGHAQLEGIDG